MNNGLFNSLMKDKYLSIDILLPCCINPPAAPQFQPSAVFSDKHMRLLANQRSGAVYFCPIPKFGGYFFKQHRNFICSLVLFLAWNFYNAPGHYRAAGGCRLPYTKPFGLGCFANRFAVGCSKAHVA